MSPPRRLLLAAVLLVGCEGDITGEACFGGFLPFAAIYCVGGIGIASLLGWMFVQMMQWRRLAHAADRTVGAGRLQEGPAVLCGHVCTDEPSPPARVEIEQAGSESKDSSGDWTHRWEEKQRRLHVRPFTMELTSGERIRVEPTRKVVLADALDGLVRVNKAARVLTAELTPGEAFIASGKLVRRPVADGYRGSRDTWVLTSPGTGRPPMLLSTEPLGRRFRSRSRGAAAAMLFTLLGALALHVLAGGYHLRLWRGHSVPAETLRVLSFTTRDSDDDPHHHRELTVRLPDGSTFTSEISIVSRTQGAYVRLVPGFRPANALGRTATAHAIVLVPHLIWPFIALGAFGAMTPRRWYEGSKQRSGGSGRLQ